MPTLQFKGFPHTATYQGPTGHWAPGDTKELSKADADQLVADFPGAFEAVGSAVAAPKKSRAVKSPTKRGGASKAKGGDK
jgi:hypothetical protein